jgi:ERCC4-type nuclease
MRAAGMTLQEIADVMGVSKGRVTKLTAAAPQTQEQINAVKRFPGIVPALAVRLARRFADERALRWATDPELLSMRGMGPIQFARVRARYPSQDEHIAKTPADRGGELVSPALS